MRNKKGITKEGVELLRACAECEVICKIVIQERKKDVKKQNE